MGDIYGFKCLHRKQTVKICVLFEMYHILPFLSSVACFIKKWFHKRHYEGVKKEKLSKEMPTFTVAKSKKQRKIEPMDNIPFSSLTSNNLNRTKELLSEELKRQSPIGTINHQQVNGCQLSVHDKGK